MTRSDNEIQTILMRALNEPYIEFNSDSPESDRQKIYRMKRPLAVEMPLLWAKEMIVRIRDNGAVVIEWKSSVVSPLEINTERPKELEIRTAQPKKAFKWPKWLEARRAGFVEFQEKAEALAKQDPAEYLGGWQDLDTLIIACDRLAEILEKGGDDLPLEKYIRSADRNLVNAVFLGEDYKERTDPIESLRIQIADIPVDDLAREGERLELIRRREKLMLERDQRLLNTNPL